MITRFLTRLRFSAHTKLVSDNSWYFLGPSVRCTFSKNSKITLNNAKIRIGFPLPGAIRYSSRMESVIHLGENAQVEFLGDVFIAPGVTIRVKDNAVLTFAGQNMIGHDSLLLCGKQMTLGRKACLSWNVTLIDDDGHFFYNADGNKLRKLSRPLNIGNNVGIQMNVVVPGGVTIGENSVVSANTILRQDVPANCLVYTMNELKVKDGITTGFQYSQ